MAAAKNQVGWIGKLSPNDCKIQITVGVKKKYYLIAEKEIKELIKKYR